MTSLIIMIIIGFVVGVLMLSLGGGGGAIYLGLLTAVFQLPPKTAAATSIITAFPALVLGCWSYYRHGLINFHLGNRMLIAAIPSVIIGYLISPYIPENVYKVIIGVILAYLGLEILLQLKGKKKRQSKLSPKFASILYGILAGLMVGVAGLSGGGAITAGLFLIGASLAEVSATSSYVLVGMSLVGGLLHMSGGNVDWNAAIGLIIGSLAGALLAPPIAVWLSNDAKRETIIKAFVAIMLILMGIKTAWIF